MCTVRVLYLHQYFATPEGSWGTRSYEFARRLVAAGHEVTVVTSTAALPERLRRGPSRFEVDGIQVMALDVEYAQSMSFFRRKAAFLEFAIRATMASRSLPADVVFATSTPLTIALPGVMTARRRARTARPGAP